MVGIEHVRVFNILIKIHTAIIRIEVDIYLLVSYLIITNVSRDRFVFERLRVILQFDTIYGSKIMVKVKLNRLFEQFLIAN